MPVSLALGEKKTSIDLRPTRSTEQFPSQEGYTVRLEVGKGTHPGWRKITSVNPTLKKLRQEGHQKFKVITSYRINPYLKMNKSHSEYGDTNMNRKNRGNNEKGY